MKNNVGVTIYPQNREFTIQIGSRYMESRSYANSSNTYRGARAAARNLLKGNITADSNHGDEFLAITNANGFVIASNEFSSRATAKRAATDCLKRIKGLKKKDLQAEVVR